MTSLPTDYPPRLPVVTYRKHRPLNDWFGGMLKKFGIIVGLCIFVVGCSSLKFAYGFVETVLRDRAEIYLDIREGDGQALEAEIRDLVSWHRTEMLPQYALFFESQAQLAEGANWSRTQVDEAVTMFRVMIKDTSLGAAPHIARVLINHTSKSKVNHIQVAMDEVLSERRERYDEPLTDQIDAAVDKFVVNFERFFGTLTEVQIAIVREHKMQTYDPTGGWLDWRDKRQQGLVRFLRTEPSTSAIESYIKVALTTPEKIIGQAYRERADRWWAEQTALLYDLIITLDIEQRQTFADNLHGYAVDMVELANAS